MDRANRTVSSNRWRSVSALSFPADPTCTPKKEPTTVPTKLVVAPMAVATLVTSFHLKIALQ